MRHLNYWLLIVLCLVALSLVACEQTSLGSSGNIEPASVQEIEGTELNRVILTERAAERLGIQTVAVQEERIDGTQRMVIPYSAVIYGLRGETWIYVSLEPLIFFRAPILVDYIEGDKAVLAEGPDIGTEVATVGVAELYGIDTGVGK